MSGTSQSSVLVVARLNDRTLPLDRGDRYEDPLDAVLKELGLGEVTGGGSQLSQDGEIVFCDVEFRLNSAGDDALAVVKRTLEERGAPKGSKLLVDSPERELPFGVNEGLAVYLNGTDLADEVYQTCDCNFVYAEFDRLLGPDGSVHGYWSGPTETALYLFGPSFQTMTGRIRDFLDSYALCRLARVVQIA